MDINNDQDVLDSRDICDRITHLEQLEQLGPIDLGDDDNARDQDGLFAELRILRELVADINANAGDQASDGVILIRDSYFLTYAEELADDIGAIPKDAGWPLTYIDWEAAADALQQDYTSISWDGVTYWVRS